MKGKCPEAISQPRCLTGPPDVSELTYPAVPGDAASWPPPSGQRVMVAGDGSERAVGGLTPSPGFCLGPIPSLQGHSLGELEPEVSGDHVVVEPDP